jgi:hypothetical protein
MKPRELDGSQVVLKEDLVWPTHQTFALVLICSRIEVIRCELPFIISV